ncbi:uncharacterized protein LOC143289694 [Babylonia areolata]|uniref:uncharacterized protein LOC143289694 n=1 Tax=Babylonia areolata TaxID=304850 RepID=UPI003FD47496
MGGRDVTRSLAQIGNIFIDSVHGFRVEYDDRHNVVLMVNGSACYLVKAVDSQWDSLIRHRDDLHAATEAIFKLIQADSGAVQSITHAQAEQYHSRLEEFQCRRKQVYQVDYTPSSA